jgi:hypothetical protein
MFKRTVKTLFQLSCSFFLIVALTSAHSRHEYHVSVTQMHYNAAQKTLELSIRTFTDDLEQGLSAANANRRFVLRNDDQNNPFVERYIKKHLALADPSRQLREFHYIGKEQEADATWLYLEIPFSGAPDGWVLRHDLLMEVFNDQVNMVNMKWGGNKRTYLFKKSQSIQPL